MGGMLSSNEPDLAALWHEATAEAGLSDRSMIIECLGSEMGTPAAKRIALKIPS